MESLGQKGKIVRFEQQDIAGRLFMGHSFRIWDTYIESKGCKWKRHVN